MPLLALPMKPSPPPFVRVLELFRMLVKKKDHSLALAILGQLPSLVLMASYVPAVHDRELQNIGKWHWALVIDDMLSFRCWTCLSNFCRLRR